MRHLTPSTQNYKQKFSLLSVFINTTKTFSFNSKRRHHETLSARSMHSSELEIIIMYAFCEKMEKNHKKIVEYGRKSNGEAKK